MKNNFISLPKAQKNINGTQIGSVITTNIKIRMRAIKLIGIVSDTYTSFSPNPRICWGLNLAPLFLKPLTQQIYFYVPQ